MHAFKHTKVNYKPAHIIFLLFFCMHISHPHDFPADYHHHHQKKPTPNQAFLHHQLKPKITTRIVPHFTAAHEHVKNKSETQLSHVRA